MPTINTQELTGAALDWAVAHGEGIDAAISRVHPDGTRSIVTFYSDEGDGVDGRVYSPSEHPGDGHHILERERISLQHLGDRIGWGARWPTWVPDGDGGETIPAASGPTMLIAGLRCLVTARLGSTVHVPEELLP